MSGEVLEYSEVDSVRDSQLVEHKNLASEANSPPFKFDIPVLDVRIASVQIEEIRIDPDVQSRQKLNCEVIREYSSAYQSGKAMPAVSVFQEGEWFWLSDGFHRVAAARDAGLQSILCEVRLGDKRTAILFSVGANAHRGLPRSNEDKRRSVRMLLSDSEWNQFSNREIGKIASVSHTLVAAIRNPLIAERQRENRANSSRKALGLESDSITNKSFSTYIKPDLSRGVPSSKIQASWEVKESIDQDYEGSKEMSDKDVANLKIELASALTKVQRLKEHNKTLEEHVQRLKIEKDDALQMAAELRRRLGEYERIPVLN